MANTNTTVSAADVTCNSGKGFIIVQVYTANGSVPIQGARVTIYEKNGNVLYELYTDRSGRTNRAEFCVPNAAQSQTEGNGNTYGSFDIKVEKQGYYTEEFLDVAVFDQIESIQPVLLEPIGENAAESDKSSRPDNGSKNIGAGGEMSDNSARIGDTLIIKEEPKPVADTNQTGQEGI